MRKCREIALFAILARGADGRGGKLVAGAGAFLAGAFLRIQKDTQNLFPPDRGLKKRQRSETHQGQWPAGPVDVL